MKQKILLLTIIAICFTKVIFSQSVGIKSGINLAYMVSKEDGKRFDDDMKEIKIGPLLGITGQFKINEKLYIEANLLLTTKGVKYKEIELLDNITLQMSSTMLYLDIPVHFGYKYEFEKFGIYCHSGPYVDLGLIGYFKTTVLDETEYDKINWGNKTDESDHYKVLDFGMNIGTGLEFKSFQLGYLYSYGITDISPLNSSYEYNRINQISVTYYFN